ncbi:MAG: S41 family peptidase [Ignavibacteria bacterium]|nr:S41 family peptidase [Ignavibacteria bacterium]
MNVFPKSLNILFVLIFLFFSNPIVNSRQENSLAFAFNFQEDTTEEDIEIDTLNEDNFDLEELIKYLQSLPRAEEGESSDSLYFEIVKAFDIFGAAIRELLKSYVVELSPMELVKFALDGVTMQLDPYTNFFSDEGELNEVVSNKEYVGLGIVVSVVDSSLIVVDFIDSLAKDLSQLKIGDKIVAIDKIKLPANLDTLKRYTSGKENSSIEITVEREGVDTLVRITTIRRKIEIPDVSYHKIFDVDGGKVLYINIEHFSPEMPQSVRSLMEKYNKFSSKEKKGIIIDLRDNPGGTLESAIQLCEMFLPSGAKIVSTRGRLEEEAKEYKAVLAPLDTSTPLVVIVNRGTASASEVVAGAIQDNDRGVIVGEQTFGKGIIQSVAVLPHNSYIKVTTSKYFTPSGRSIHRNRFGSTTSGKIGRLYTMDTIFYTRNGRIVKESKGIQPDVIITEKEGDPFVNFLYSKQLFTLFVSYLENTKTLDKELISNSQKLLNSFINYLIKKGIDFKSEEEKELETVIKKLQSQKKNPKIEKKLKEIEKELHRPIDILVKENEKKILEALRSEIQRRLVSFEEFRFYILQEDINFKKSVELLKDKNKYFKIVGN